MGIFVNPGNVAFEMSRFSDVYIDKSMLISKTNAAYKTEKRFFCASRPRRFGKSECSGHARMDGRHTGTAVFRTIMKGHLETECKGCRRRYRCNPSRDFVHTEIP